MNAVWAAGSPLSVREVLDTLNAQRSEPLAYTTVMTVMTRLTAKGALFRDRDRRSFKYEAAAPDAAGIAVREVLRSHGDAALAHFAHEARSDPAVLRRLTALLEDDGAPR